MENLVQLTEKIASKAVMADPTDLNTLADLHSGLQEMSEVATKQLPADGKQESVVNVARSAEKLLEQIILREVKDAAACLQTVNQTIQDLQSIVAGVMGSTPPEASQEDVAAPAAETPAAEAAAEAAEAAAADAPAAEDPNATTLTPTPIDPAVAEQLAAVVESALPASDAPIIPPASVDIPVIDSRNPDELAAAEATAAPEAVAEAVAEEPVAEAPAVEAAATESVAEPVAEPVAEAAAEPVAEAPTATAIEAPADAEPAVTIAESAITEEPAAAAEAAPEPVAEAPAPVAAAAPAAPAAEEPHIDPELAINKDDVTLAFEFIAEARSHIDTAEAEILKVEENPEDLEAVNSIFRAFHTIKGVAGFLNLKQIGALAHTSENLLDLARKGKLKLAGNSVDLVLEAIDGMKNLIAGLESALNNATEIPVESGLPNLISRLIAFINGDTNVASSGRKNAPAAAAAPAAAPVAESKPTPAATAAPTPVEAAQATPAEVPAEAPAAEAEPVVEAAAAPVAAPEAPKAAAPEAEVPAKAEHEAKPAAQAGGANHGGQQAEATVKVATDRLDNLINMVGELVIAQLMVSQDCSTYSANNPRLGRNMSHLSKITRELQDLSMSMRMVPIQGVFQKMARLARDLSRKSGKDIDFQVAGGETELDRNIVEAISDPLIHMVRNAADHGIEMPEDRVKAGKPRTGKITLRAYHQAGNIVIEIVDDGKGLNKAKIRKKAIEAGVITPEQELSEQDIFRLIFHPGLSTADKITDVSGRGVGMDVVRKNVEQLRGRIDIASTEGVGSTFAIRLPLTLAVIDGLVVKIGVERYIIPITSIEQSLRPKADQISTVQNRGEQCMIRGQILPLFRLYKLFNVTPRSEDPTEALVVIVQDDQRRCCLMVDELLGQQQVVIKSMGEAVGQVKGISGGAILGDGCVSLIMDIPGIIALATNR